MSLRGTVTLIIALALLIAALFMPKWQLPRDTFNYIVVFDITQSMDVEDYELGATPASRLTFARDAVRRTLRDLPCGSKVGWGAFAEYRSLVLLQPVEVCENYNDLLASLEGIDGRMRWANASEVGKGIYWSVRMALVAESKPDILFISDGHEAPPLDPTAPLSMPDDVQPGKVRGWVIGAGGDTPMPIPRTDEDDRRIGFWGATDVIQLVSPDGTRIVSREQLSTLREPHLRALADRVGFGYMRLTTRGSIREAMLDPHLVRRDRAATDLTWLPLSGALLLLLSRFLPDLRPRRGLSPRLTR